MDLDELPLIRMAHEDRCPPHLDRRVASLREAWDREDPSNRAFAERLHIEKVNGGVACVAVTAQEVGDGVLTHQDLVLIGPDEPEPGRGIEMLRSPGGHVAGGGCIEVLASDERQVFGRFHARTITGTTTRVVADARGLPSPVVMCGSAVPAARPKPLRRLRRRPIR